MITDKELRVLDIHGAQAVEVIIDWSAGSNRTEQTLWVNINGLCRLRVGGIIPTRLLVDINGERVAP